MPTLLSAMQYMKSPRHAAGILFLIAAGALLYPYLTRDREHGPPPPHYRCQTNLKQLRLSLEMYIKDNGGYLPPPERWNRALDPYMKSTKIFTCPFETGELPTYSVNSALRGVKIADLEYPDRTVMLFDSAPGVNRYGGIESAVFRDKGQCNVAFADGHVHGYGRFRLKRLIWAPHTLPEIGR